MCLLSVACLLSVFDVMFAICCFVIGVDLFFDLVMGSFRFVCFVGLVFVRIDSCDTFCFTWMLVFVKRFGFDLR